MNQKSQRQESQWKNVSIALQEQSSYRVDSISRRTPWKNNICVRHCPAVPPPQRALIRFQGGPLPSRPFVCCRTSRLTKFSSLSFRVSSPLALSLHLSSRNCRCGRPVDCLGHQRSACAVGAAWVCRRERHRQDMPGGRRTRVNERVRAGLGSRNVQSPRWPSSRSCGRRFVTVWWGWPLTQFWNQRCVGTAPQGKAQLVAMALPPGRHTDERRRVTLNSEGEGGRLWQLRRLGTSPTCCKPESRLLGSAACRTSSRV